MLINQKSALSPTPNARTIYSLLDQASNLKQPLSGATRRWALSEPNRYFSFFFCVFFFFTAASFMLRINDLKASLFVMRTIYFNLSSCPHAAHHSCWWEFIFMTLTVAVFLNLEPKFCQSVLQVRLFPTGGATPSQREVEFRKDGWLTVWLRHQ